MNKTTPQGNPPKQGPQNSHGRHDGMFPVHFEYKNANATTVCVAGTFNDWHPHAKAMHFVGNGEWSKETVLPAGTYEYCLVVDGKFIPDPHACESVPNPFGGKNSVLKVPCPTKEPASTPAKPLPPQTKQTSNV